MRTGRSTNFKSLATWEAVKTLSPVIITSYLWEEGGGGSYYKQTNKQTNFDRFMLGAEGGD